MDADLVAVVGDTAHLLGMQQRRHCGIEKAGGDGLAFCSSARMRGIAWRLPYWPWLMRIGLSSASRSGIVSWSASKLIATAQRAPSGQAFGFRLRPARARPTMRRQVGFGHCHGSLF